jgi:hypothetical protein
VDPKRHRETAESNLMPSPTLCKMDDDDDDDYDKGERLR